MYAIISKGELLALCERPRYVKRNEETGAYVEAAEAEAIGIAVGGEVYNLPGGRVEPGESGQNAAERELMEETGVAPQDASLRKMLRAEYFMGHPHFLSDVVRHGHRLGRHLRTLAHGDVVHQIGILGIQIPRAAGVDVGVGHVIHRMRDD